VICSTSVDAYHYSKTNGKRRGQVHIAGLIITPIKNGKQSDVTYINIIKHADEFDLPVVARRLFSDHMVR
jgi:hypothetical protein